MGVTNDSILLVEQEQGILTLTLNRPSSANALNPELTEALYQAITQTEGIRLCVIRSNGRHFCAGFDLSDLEDLSDGDLLWRFLRIETLLQAVHHAHFPVIALAHGQVVGAGADLFAACWRRVAAPNVKLKMPGWNFELALGTRRLTHLIGQDAARDLLIDTKMLSSEECFQCGLATDLVELENWDEFVERISQRTKSLSPFALNNMLEATARDTRDDDIVTIIKTAGRPGLKERIMAYRNQVKASKKN